jgi:hypothetical protein
MLKEENESADGSLIKSNSSSSLSKQQSTPIDPSQQQAQQTNNPITRKLNKILESKIENDKELLESLKTLSSFVSDNSIRSRRNLRSDIEKRSLTLNEEFLSAFRNIKEVNQVFICLSCP